MAADQRDTAADADRLACAPCRGTGSVASNADGGPRQVTCPWCDGTGRFIPGHDAQAARRAAVEAAGRGEARGSA